MDSKHRLTQSGLAFAILSASLFAFSFAKSAEKKKYATSYGRNYEESKVKKFTVPDPLVSKNGKRVATPEEWSRNRRAEILTDFQNLMYGHTPNLPTRLRSKIIATKRDALDGRATRTLVELRFFNDPDAPVIQLMHYLPNKTTKPVPVFLGLSFNGNASLEDDPEIPLTAGWLRPKKPAVVNNRATEALRGIGASRWPVAMAIERGFRCRHFLLRRRGAGSH